MENISLFRKWRSQTFDDIVSQKHITKTLRNVIKNPKLLAHAYLFCGPRGTGKTSMARIFAKALNCLGDANEKPCGQCRPCRSITEGSSMDVMEIDAASHTSVEMVREHIINRVNFAPVEGKYKIYIIDEVHKLSSSSFNALLKTLEEPPAHVIFILATTNPNDLPATIISRCQRFEFRRISSHDIMGRLRQICIAEGFKITESALSIMASLASGALRDAIVLLEQAVSFSEGEINAANVSSLLGLADSGFLFSLSQLVAEGKTGELLKLADRAIREGREPMRIIKDIIEHYRKILLVSVMEDAGSILDLPEESLEEYRNASMLYDSKGIDRIIGCIRTAFEAASAVKDSSLQRPLLEIALIKMSSKSAPTPVDDSKLAARVARLERAIASGTGFVPNPLLAEASPLIRESQAAAPSDVKDKQQPASETAVSAVPESHPREKADLKFSWNKIMLSIKGDRMSLYAILADPNISFAFSGSSVSISVKQGYDFHKSQIEKNIAYIAGMAEKIFGAVPEISVSFASAQQKKDKQAPAEKKQIRTPAEELNDKHKELVKEVIGIFGGRVIQF